MPYQDVQYHNDASGTYKPPVVSGQPQTPKLFLFVQSHSGGLIRTTRQAMYFLLTLVVLALIVSFFIFRSTLGTSVDTETFKARTRAPDAHAQ